MVHGIHALMWALDRCLCAIEGHVSLQSLDVSFLKPIMLGAEVVANFAQDADASRQIVLTVDGNCVAEIEFSWQSCAQHSSAKIQLNKRQKEAQPPLILRADELVNASGTFPLALDPKRLAAMLPNLARALNDSHIAVLLASSRMVGMECPGLHSLYSELHLRTNHIESESAKSKSLINTLAPMLEYRVSKFDARFGITTIVLCAPALSGTVKAFLRPTPQHQPTCSEMQAAMLNLIADDAFTGQRALIVGGSRGLGEVLAKVLALGGAEVVLSYQNGAQEAHAVVADIQASGGKAIAIRFDVHHPQSIHGLTGGEISHLYYLATPSIFCATRGVFQAPIFQRFCDYYVDGFAAIVGTIKHPGLRGVFYPSSTALDELPPDMGEYIAAKSAGEAVCRFLAKTNPTIQFAYPRLPRLATDQTMTLVPCKNLAALPLAIDLLRTIWRETP